MKTLEKEKTEIKFVREANLSPNQVKVLIKRGFIVCFIKVDEWGLDLYSIYA